MIVAVVTFRLPKPVTLAEATATFESTAPKYQGLAGLVRKNYLLSEDGTRAGGVYLWKRAPTPNGSIMPIGARWSKRNMARRLPSNTSNPR